jgi:hypothetical protein
MKQDSDSVETGTININEMALLINTKRQQRSNNELYSRPSHDVQRTDTTRPDLGTRTTNTRYRVLDQQNLLL